MEDWDIGTFLVERVPHEVGPVRLLGADRDLQNPHTWRTRFAPIDTKQGRTDLWTFGVDVCWEPDATAPTLQFVTFADIQLPLSARRWLEGKVQTYNNQVETHLGVLMNPNKGLSLFASIMTGVTVQEALLLSQESPPQEAIEMFYVDYEEVMCRLLTAWQNGRALGHLYRKLH